MQGANSLYQAFQKGLTYKREDFGPEGDLFTPGIQHICGMIARNVDVSKILTVHFEYTPSDCCLPIAALPSSMYLLPKHLSSLLQQIHKLNGRNEDLTKVSPCSVCLVMCNLLSWDLDFALIVCVCTCVWVHV